MGLTMRTPVSNGMNGDEGRSVPRSRAAAVLVRGAVIKLSSVLKFRTNWFYVLFVSSRSGRTLAGYVMDGVVRKLTSTLKIADLTPAEDEIADRKSTRLN